MSEGMKNRRNTGRITPRAALVAGGLMLAAIAQGSVSTRVLAATDSLPPASPPASTPAGTTDATVQPAGPDIQTTLGLCLAPFRTVQDVTGRFNGLGWQPLAIASVDDDALGKLAEIDMARKFVPMPGDAKASDALWKKGWMLARRNARGLARLVETPKSTVLRRYFTDPASGSILALMISRGPGKKWLSCDIGATASFARALMPAFDKAIGQPQAKRGPMTGVPGNVPARKGVRQYIMAAVFNPAAMEPLIGRKPSLSVVLDIYYGFDPGKLVK